MRRRMQSIYLTIYDAWRYEKKQKLQFIGCNIKVLWEVSLREKGISGSDVRRLIVENKDWGSYVPKYVYDYIRFHHLDEKLKAQYI